ncbi:MAG: hypothetical protein GX601_11235 [Anaerolineales bacterium]|nr:hypothetical protein [Anaerolineales bacterium]
MNWIPFLWMAASLAALLLIERWIHRHLQGVALLLTGEPEMAAVVYALPLLPGIVLHEVSHALAALLLGVRVGRIHVRPQLSGQRIQLGFVPVERTDAVRASLIGLAPLLVGSAVTLIIGAAVFSVSSAGTALPGDWAALREELREIAAVPDGWIWAYVVFTISATMLPSRADRQAWTPVLLFLALASLLVGAASFASGFGPTVAQRLADPVTVAMRWLAGVCTFTLAVDLPFVLLIAGAEWLVGRIRGLRVEY